MLAAPVFLPATQQKEKQGARRGVVVVAEIRQTLERSPIPSFRFSLPSAITIAASVTEASHSPKQKKGTSVRDYVKGSAERPNRAYSELSCCFVATKRTPGTIFLAKQPAGLVFLEPLRAGSRQKLLGAR